MVGFYSPLLILTVIVVQFPIGQRLARCEEHRRLGQLTDDIETFKHMEELSEAKQRKQTQYEGD